MKDELDESKFTKRTIAMEKSKIDKHIEEEIINEGHYTANQLKKVQEEHEDACVWLPDSESDSESESEKGSIGNKSKSESENKNVENKQSPIDFVVEKQQCEMPDVTDSDGGE
jgi:hypothetical protein